MNKFTELTKLSADQLQVKYEEMMMGYTDAPGQAPMDPGAKAISDLCLNANFSERKKYLLTIIYQQWLINDLRETITKIELRSDVDLTEGL